MSGSDTENESSDTNTVNENSELNTADENDGAEENTNTYAYDNIMLNIARKNNEFRRIKGEDITGFDATYTTGYCEAFYEQDLLKADSSGFLNQTIISRVNGKAAPIDLLSDAIKKQHADGSPEIKALRANMSQIRNDIVASAQANEAVGE
jgi:hypothetical protein